MKELHVHTLKAGRSMEPVDDVEEMEGQKLSLSG